MQLDEDKIKKNVIIETSLLKALAKRVTYDDYIAYVDVSKLLLETQTLLECYKQYYDLYQEHNEINFETFLSQFKTNWHSQGMTTEDLQFFNDAIIKIKEDDDVEAQRALLGLINKQFLQEVNKLGEKDFTIEQLHKTIDRYEINRSAVLSEFDKDHFKLDEIDLSTANAHGGIPYAFNALQQALIGQVQGDLIVVNAHHGIGKSVFCYTQMVHTFIWLHKQKINRPILFFNSEGSAAQAFGRFLSCLYRDKCLQGYAEIIAKQDKIKAHFFKNYKSELWKIFRSNGRGFGFIREKVKKYNPAVVFIDMAKGAVAPSKKNESETSSLEAFFQGLRDLSATTCPIWATVQAGDSALWHDKDNQVKKHKRWIDSSDIYGSKTGIQGAASTIISIGMDDNRPLTRYIHTTKVKAENNAKFICIMEKKHSYYKEVEQNINEASHDKKSS